MQQCWGCGKHFLNLQAIRAHQRWCEHRGERNYAPLSTVLRHDCGALEAVRGDYVPPQCHGCGVAGDEWVEIGEARIPVGPIEPGTRVELVRDG